MMNSLHLRQLTRGSSPTSTPVNINKQFPTPAEGNDYALAARPREREQLETAPLPRSSRPADSRAHRRRLKSLGIRPEGIPNRAKARGPSRGLQILLDSLKEEEVVPSNQRQALRIDIPLQPRRDPHQSARTASSHSNTLGASIASYTGTDSSELSASGFPLPPTFPPFAPPIEPPSQQDSLDRDIFAAIFDDLSFVPEGSLHESDMVWPPGGPSSQTPEQTEAAMRDERNQTPQRAIFEDLPTAYTSITSRTLSPGHSQSSSSSPESDNSVRRYVGSPSRVPRGSPHANASLVSSPLETKTPGPLSPATWKDKVNHLSNRGLQKKQNDLQKSDVEANLQRKVTNAIADTTAHSPTYLKPFNRISQSSQSAPQFSSHNPYHDTGEPEEAQLAGLPGHYASEGLEYRNAGESMISGISFRNHPSEPSSVPRQSEEDQGRVLDISALSQRLPRDDTLESYEDSMEFVDQDSDDDAGVSAVSGRDRSYGLSTFDFGLGSNQSGLAASASSEVPDIPQVTALRPHLRSATQPPTTPLPPPPARLAGPAFLDQRELSETSTALSPSTSYGDTGNLLNLTQPLSLSFTPDGSQYPSYKDFKESGKAGSRLSGATDSKGNHHTKRSEIGTPPPLLSSKTSGGSAEEKSNQSSPNNPSARSDETVLRMPGVPLEDDITRELRRVSRLSGKSTLSGSVVVVNENGLQALERRSGHGIDVDPGHGGFQSSSSGDLMGNVDEPQRHDSGQSDSDHDSPVHDKAVDTWKNEKRGHGVPACRTEPDRFGDDFAEEEDDGDWETVAGSGALSRFGTGQDMTRAVTGSSLANFSSFASMAPEEHRASFGITGDVLQHPGDPRYDFAYRLRQITPGQTPVLLPSYVYPGGASFPDRNSLTPPLPANWNSRNPDRHPSPLSNDHAHPFKSSPPTIKSTGPQEEVQMRVITYDEEDSAHGMPAHYISSQNFATSGEVVTPANRDMSFQESIGTGSIADSYTSSAWMSTYGGMPRNTSESQGLSGCDGSFSKITNLGPKANITGTPEGTGMREVGSSLADGSSPAAKWSSSPLRYKSSPMAPMDTLPEQLTPIASPTAAVLRSSPRSPHYAEHTETDTRIRAHRGLLRKEGRLPNNGIAPPPPPKDRPSGLGHRTRVSSSVSPRFVDFEPFSETADHPQPFEKVSLRNERPLLQPTPVEHIVGVEREARLRQRARENSSIAIFTRKRKRNISRIILAVCFVFPPLLLLYGYGVLDVVMLELTQGGIRRFGRGERKFALCAGWIIGGAAIIGIVASMIVVGIGK